MAQRQPTLLPPGPPGLPIFGNMVSMPTRNEWIVFKEWGSIYGEIMSVTIAGRPLVIVNSSRAMAENFTGLQYADRPRLEFAGERVGYAKTLVLHPYSKRFLDYRKCIRPIIGTSQTVEKLAALEQYETHRFVQSLLKEPDQLAHHLRKMSGSIILKITYGIQTDKEIEDLVVLIEQANNNFNAATAPGAFLVDYFPSMRFIPSWLPGGKFKTLVPKFKAAFDAMVEKPYERAKQLIRENKAMASCVSKALEDIAERRETPTDEQEFIIKHAAASLYGGGADTTVACQHAFVLAMILHPEVQKKAQVEIDQVTHGIRFPTLADRKRMPYVEAMVTEALRWHSIAPTGIPHRVTQDSVVSGTYADGRRYEYAIPEDSIVIFNLWAMLHDENTYHDPFKFNPERHMGNRKEYDPRKICFGIGGRACPGLHLADASLFLFIATMLALFDIGPARDRNGKPVYPLPVHDNLSGSISHPKPFEYSIRPRSPDALALINTEPIAP